MQEKRNDKAYNLIPLKTRIIIRTVIILIKLTIPSLRKLKLAPYFSLEIIEETAFVKEKATGELFQ